MKKVYIAGKVTGLPFHEVSMKFGEAQKTIEALGFEVVNPIALINDIKCDWSIAMKTCIKALLDCDALVILKDWEESTGAKIERQLADDVNMLVVTYTKRGLNVLVKNLE